jgi:hypothetical protein
LGEFEKSLVKKSLVIIIIIYCDAVLCAVPKNFKSAEAHDADARYIESGAVE